MLRWMLHGTLHGGWLGMAVALQVYNEGDQIYGIYYIYEGECGVYRDNKRVAILKVSTRHPCCLIAITA